MKKIDYLIKQKLIELTGLCFWYWRSFYTFLDSSGIPRQIYDRYPKSTYSKYDVMRGILDYIEQTQDFSIYNKIISNFYRIRGAVDKDSLDNKKAAEALREFREIVKNDPIDNAIEEKSREKAKEAYGQLLEQKKLSQTRLQTIYEKFKTLMSSTDYSAQQRGFQLENIIYELLNIEGIEHSKSYKTSTEQIDGHFKFEGFDYLVEAKWEKNLTGQRDLSIFEGKIKNKAQSTRGCFISITGFDENGITTFMGNSPRLILLDGLDLIKIFEGYSTLYECMEIKVKRLVRYGEILYHI